MGTKFEVSKKEEMTELEFISYRAIMKEEGKFAFTFDRVSYNDEAGSAGTGEVVTLVSIDNSQACAVWITPYPDAQFEVNVTDGERLVKALIRAFHEHLPVGSVDVESIIAVANNENGGSLTVEKVKMDNGHDAWRWSVKPSA